MRLKYTNQGFWKRWQGIRLQQSSQQRWENPRKYLKTVKARGQETEVVCVKGWDSYHESISLNRQHSHSNVNMQSQQPSRRVGILAPQSLVQIEVSTQSTARREWDRVETDRNIVCAFVYDGKSVSSCLWREDGEKQPGSSSQLRQENSC